MSTILAGLAVALAICGVCIALEDEKLGAGLLLASAGAGFAAVLLNKETIR